MFLGHMAHFELLNVFGQSRSTLIPLDSLFVLEYMCFILVRRHYGGLA